MRNVLLIASLAAVAVAGCTASDRPSTQTAANTPQSRPTTSSAPAPTGPACTAADFKVAGDFGAKPTITIPTTCQPGKDLIISDLKPGTGAEVKQGSTATVNYLLMTFSDSKVVDNSFDRGAPFDVENVGQASVIEGWNEGLVGLKEGGRRMLVIPSDKGYGPTGNQGIKPNETLVFVIDAVKVTG